MRSIDIGRIQGIYVWNLATHFGMLSPRRHNQTGPSAKSESGNIMHHTPNPIWALPFLTILGAIATLPLIHKTAHAWEKNQNKFLLSVILSLITLGYYGIREFGFHDAAPGAASVQAVLEHAVIEDYIPFVVLWLLEDSGSMPTFRPLRPIMQSCSASEPF